MKKRGLSWRPCGRNNRSSTIAWIRQSVPYQTPDLMEQFLSGMRKAGLT